MNIRIPTKEKPIQAAGMNLQRYEFAHQYFLTHALMFSNNGGKSFKRTVHILHPEAASWAEFAFGNKQINTITNVTGLHEQKLAQTELNQLWYHWAGDIPAEGK